MRGVFFKSHFVEEWDLVVWLFGQHVVERWKDVDGWGQLAKAGDELVWGECSGKELFGEGVDAGAVAGVGQQLGIKRVVGWIVLDAGGVCGRSMVVLDVDVGKERCGQGAFFGKVVCGMGL